MWSMIIIVSIWGGASQVSTSTTTVDGFTSREKCISAVKFSKARKNVQDAW